MKVDAMSALVPTDRIRTLHPTQSGTSERGSCGVVKMNRFCRSAYRHLFGPVPTPLIARNLGRRQLRPLSDLSPVNAEKRETMEVSDAIRA
jgi:hypothetical protein